MYTTVFEFDSYAKYLEERLSGGGKRGTRGQLAKYLNCQSSFISQVITGRSHFSLEHGIKISEFLGHSERERDYFMLLVQHNRAGSEQLKAFYGSQLSKLRVAREAVTEKIGVHEKLEETDIATYYSAWWYAAIHILVSIPKLNSVDKIAQRLKMNPSTVKDCLDFLVSRRIVKREKNGYGIGKNRVHLNNQSPLLISHHTGWRMRSIQALESRSPEAIHFSSVLAISKHDGIKLRKMLLELVQKSDEIIKLSEEETAYVMGLDFFEL